MHSTITELDEGQLSHLEDCRSVCQELSVTRTKQAHPLRSASIHLITKGLHSCPEFLRLDPFTPVILQVPFELKVKSVKHMSMCISPLSIQPNQHPIPKHRYSGLVILHMKFVFSYE